MNSTVDDDALVVEPASVTSAFYSTGGSQNGFARTDGVSPTLKVGSGLDIASPPAVSFEQPIVAPTLTAANNPSRSPQSTEVTQQIEAVHRATISFERPAVEVTQSLTTRFGNSGPDLPDAEAGWIQKFGPSVRRLTPTECERLMGWPDGWTAVDGDKTPDGRRYAACGNGVVANVSEWIGRRIMAIEEES